MLLRLTLLLGAVAATGPRFDAAAQSALDRTPNLSGNWTGAAGVVHFNFLHRFAASDAPTRKVSSSPTLLLAASVARPTLVGFTYSSNSLLSPAYPNEWEFFGRFAPLRQGESAPVDVGMQVSYNLAARGFDGELSAARREGPVSLLAAGRFLADPISDAVDVALIAGTVVRLNPYIALAADAGTLTERAAGEKIAWGVGLQLGIPHSPHSLSLHVTNTNNGTLQSSSRGTDDTRFGFEFTIPVTLQRYFGGGPPANEPQPPAVPTPAPAEPEAGRRATPDTVQASMADFRFEPQRLEVPRGTTVIWTNTGQVAHSVTAQDGSFNTGLIQPRQRAAIVFDRPGTFSFHCMPHPFMTGTVVVR